MFAQFGLHFQHLQLAIVDVVGTADEVFVTFEQVQVLLLHGDTVVFTLHLIIRLGLTTFPRAASEGKEQTRGRNDEEKQGSGEVGKNK